MSSSFENHSIYHAIYSDGKTAGSQNIKVVFGVNQLELRHENGELLDEWNYDEITTIDHFHPGDASQLGHKDNPGTRLYIDRGDFAAELISHLPHMSRKAVNRRIYFSVGIVGLVVMALIGGIWVSGYSIPQAIANLIPDNVRKGLGKQVIAGLSGGKTACTGVEGSKAFAKLLDRIAKGAGQSEKFDVQIIDIGMMNAFAAPGEHIVVSKKLVNFVKSPEELAGVIAHEMGHGIKMHPEAGIVRALGISAGINMAFGGATGGLGDIGAMLLQLKYSRSAEFEADAIALSILEAAEIPAKPFASFFVRLEEKHGRGKKKNASKKKQSDSKDDYAAAQNGLSKTLALLSSHPSSPERIAIIKKQPEWKIRPIMSPEEWKALRNICVDEN